MTGKRRIKEIKYVTNQHVWSFIKLSNIIVFLKSGCSQIFKFQWFICNSELFTQLLFIWNSSLMSWTTVITAQKNDDCDSSTKLIFYKLTNSSTNHRAKFSNGSFYSLLVRTNPRNCFYTYNLISGVFFIHAWNKKIIDVNHWQKTRIKSKKHFHKASFYALQELAQYWDNCNQLKQNRNKHDYVKERK